MAEDFLPTELLPDALPPPPGNKRNRRMRSLQGQVGGGDKKKGKGSKKRDEFIALERSGAPPFLIKTYQMISTCNPELAEWSENGDMFIVKNPTKFAEIEIPKYFDHKNFSSFSRQLNFYGFKKVNTKTIRIDQEDKAAAGYVRFYNEKFKRGRTDLLCKIQRSTKNSGNAQNQAQEIKILKDKVSTLESQLDTMSFEMNKLISQVQKLTDNASSKPQDYTNQEVPMSQQADKTFTHNTGYEVPEAQPSMHQESHAPVDAATYDGNGYSHQPNDYGSQQLYLTSNQGNEGSQWDNEPTPVVDNSGPTLAPHPNTKHLDPNFLPMPPPIDATTNRNVSLLRGLSGAFDDTLFMDGPGRVSSSTANDLNQGNMMARIQSLDISGVYQVKNELPDVDDEFQSGN